MYIKLLNHVEIGKMADIEVSGECFSHNSVKSKDNNEVTICKRCREYKIQLKEALDELISVQMINKLLQKELLSYTLVWHLFSIYISYL